MSSFNKAGSILQIPKKLKIMIKATNEDTYLNIDRYFDLFSEEDRLGLLPASPKEFFVKIYCSTPNVMPTPAAPNPQCQPTFSPRYPHTKNPNMLPIFIDI